MAEGHGESSHRFPQKNRACMEAKPGVEFNAYMVGLWEVAGH